jgi:hypothetical protein
MMWHPSSLSSVSKARFITARAISMKLCVRIPLGNMPRFFLIFAIWPFLWPTGGHLENQTFTVYELTVVAKFTKFLIFMTTSHITRVLELTYFSRSQRSKLNKLRSWRILLRFDLECSNPLHFHLISAQSDFKYGCEAWRPSLKIN